MVQRFSNSRNGAKLWLDMSCAVVTSSTGVFTLTAISCDFAVLYVYIDMAVAGALLFVRAVVRVPVRGTVGKTEEGMTFKF